MTTASTSTLACPHCGSDLPLEVLQPEGAACPACESHLEAANFPALFRAEQMATWEPVVSDEAGCFFHPDRVAVFTCSRCGRFLCPLCRIAWPGGDVCAACLEAARKDQHARAFASNRFHFDSMALMLATVPVITWFFSMVTAPVALGFAVFTLRRECSIAPRSRIRFVLAILFSTCTIAGWILFWFYLVFRSGARPRPDVHIG
jgi:hypothetical protein